MHRCRIEHDIFFCHPERRSGVYHIIRSALYRQFLTLQTLPPSPGRGNVPIVYVHLFYQAQIIAFSAAGFILYYGINNIFPVLLRLSIYSCAAFPSDNLNFTGSVISMSLLMIHLKSWSARFILSSLEVR